MTATASARAVLLLLITGMFPGSRALGQTKPRSAADEEATRQLADQYAAAFNNKDPKAVALLWAEDGEYTSLSGRAGRGRLEIESLFRDLFSGPYKEAKTRLVTQSVRFLAPDVALGRATWETSGARGPDGRERPASKTVSLSVATRRDGHWLIVSALPMVLPPAGN